MACYGLCRFAVLLALCCCAAKCAAQYPVSQTAATVAKDYLRFIDSSEFARQVATTGHPTDAQLKQQASLSNRFTNVILAEMKTHPSYAPGDRRLLNATNLFYLLRFELFWDDALKEPEDRDLVVQTAACQVIATQAARERFFRAWRVTDSQFCLDLPGSASADEVDATVDSMTQSRLKIMKEKQAKSK